MASTQALSAASQDRKARLAHLKSLKRKKPDSRDEEGDDAEEQLDTHGSTNQNPPDSQDITRGGVTAKYLSGRNYDADTRGARLGFEHAPTDGQDTLERQAAALAVETKREADEETAADRPLDLFQLQPKKPNWDLKRDLDRKLEVLNVRTDNAIARLVRERITGQQRAAKARLAEAGTQGGTSATLDNGDNEAVGIDGTMLVEAANVREREDREEARRDREEEDALLDAS